MVGRSRQVDAAMIMEKESKATSKEMPLQASTNRDDADMMCCGSSFQT